MRPTSCARHPVPCALCPVPCALHPVPCTLRCCPLHRVSAGSPPTPLVMAYASIRDRLWHRAANGCWLEVSFPADVFLIPSDAGSCWFDGELGAHPIFVSHWVRIHTDVRTYMHPCTRTYMHTHPIYASHWVPDLDRRASPRPNMTLMLASPGPHVTLMLTSHWAPCDPHAHQPWAPCDPHAHQPSAPCDPHAHQPWAPCEHLPGRD